MRAGTIARARPTGGVADTESTDAESRRVLDASAVLAWLQGETGADVVVDAFAAGSRISVFNWTEVLSKLAAEGKDPATLAEELARIGVDRETLPVEPVTEADELEIARLRPLTRTHGLSICDRACLALAKRLGFPALTADSAWEDLDDVDVTVELIR